MLSVAVISQLPQHIWPGGLGQYKNIHIMAGSTDDLHTGRWLKTGRSACTKDGNIRKHLRPHI